ncbi:hypothetical protein JOQ06_024593 [Pogonophryne albipinna]|uniref:Uncharacterized protein n=1 Tax=Pogonophryne albipinna TaxID=1090488 RepID=A0AAD6A904_9TELE|nr:hypothetical protein JOQ06_024593 [Pogonophryne albipinna]
MKRRCDEEEDEDLDLKRRCDEEDDDDEDLDLMRRCDEEEENMRNSPLSTEDVLSHETPHFCSISHSASQRGRLMSHV